MDDGFFGFLCIVAVLVFACMAITSIAPKVADKSGSYTIACLKGDAKSCSEGAEWYGAGTVGRKALKDVYKKSTGKDLTIQ